MKIVIKNEFTKIMSRLILFALQKQQSSGFFLCCLTYYHHEYCQNGLKFRVRLSSLALVLWYWICHCFKSLFLHVEFGKLPNIQDTAD